MCKPTINKLSIGFVLADAIQTTKNMFIDIRANLPKITIIGSELWKTNIVPSGYFGIVSSSVWQMIHSSYTGGAKNISFEIRDSTEHLELLIKDDGDTLPPALLLMDIFNSGLSLFSARSNMEKIGGELTHEGIGLSEKGSCFKIKFRKI